MVKEHQDNLRIFLFADWSGAIVTEIPKLLGARGHEVVGLLTAPPPRSRPGANNYLEVVESAAGAGIPTVVSARRSQWPGLVRMFDPDLCLCAGFVWKIPPDVFRIPPLGTINLHGGPLPRYRGPNMIGWGFRNDDGYLEMTAHWMEEEWDTGPVLARQRFTYGDDDDIDTLGPSWYKAIVSAINNAIAAVERGDSGEVQDESLAGYAPFFDPEWRYIDWSQPARHIHNQVRSWMGARDTPKGAIGTVDGKSLVILKTRLLTHQMENGNSPGQIVSDDGDGLIIQCGDTPLRVLEYQEMS